MIKVLLHKQWLEILMSFRQNKKNGKTRSLAGAIGMGFLFLMVMFAMGTLFYQISDVLCQPLFAMGLDWMYYSMIGLMTLCMGVFGSVFQSYSAIYKGKDNDLLLSLPIPPSAILFSRIFGIYLMSLLFQIVVLVPAFLCSWQARIAMTGSVSASEILAGIVMALFLPLLALVISCLLASLLARISPYFKNKGIITTIITILFLAVYYFFCFRMNSILSDILMNGNAIASSLKNLFFVYWMGVGMTGQIPELLMFLAFAVALFALMYWFLSVSFVRLAITGTRTKKTVYREREAKVLTPLAALGGRETARYLHSSVYMINCTLGSVFLLVMTVALIIKRADIIAFVFAFKEEGIHIDFSVVAAAAGAVVIAMNTLTAPSISLEGNTMWILRSLPVRPFDVFRSKMRFHIVLTFVPALVFAVVAAAVLGMEIPSAVLLIVLLFVYTAFNAALGLFTNLLFPNLKWKNEAVAVKQSLSVMLCMFGNWGVLALLVLGYIKFFVNMDVRLFMIACIAVFGLIWLVLVKWLKTAGCRKFETL